jgi:hypothetical protein
MKYNIKIDNLITLPERIFRLVVDLDESQIFDMTRGSILSSLEASYKTTGTKTFKVSAFIDPALSQTPITHTYTDAIIVVDKYDDIDEDLYSIHNNSFLLPVTSQPEIYPNDWGTYNVFNNTLLKLQDNLDYLLEKTYYYDCSDFNFVGWYGSTSSEDVGILIQDNIITQTHNWTWEQIETTNPFLHPKWSDFDNNSKSVYQDSNLWSCFTCLTSEPEAPKSALVDVIINVLTQNQFTDNNTCFTNTRWHVNTPLLSSYLYANDYNVNCSFTDMFVRDNLVFICDSTSLNVCVDDVRYTKQDKSVVQLTRNIPFLNITATTKSKGNSIIVCDTGNNSISNFLYNNDDIQPWGYGFIHQGLGSFSSHYKFNSPIDVCVDSQYNIYVCDSGNKCIKVYTYRGEWFTTFSVETAPLSIAVDSGDVLHVLTETKVYRYETTRFTVLNTYTIDNTDIPIRIRANFSKEILYVCSSTEIIKYFKNGKKYCNVPISLTGITNVYQDENRNLYIFTKGRVFKYFDPMFIANSTNFLSLNYWSRDDIKIAKDEYVQDWVYNRAFHRMWDNIELFRSCLKYKQDNVCKSFTKPLYTKEDIFIGQNEIVTSAVVNRCLRYLWLNLCTLYKYFDNTCV